MDERTKLFYDSLNTVMEDWVNNVYDQQGGILRSDQLPISMATAAMSVIGASEDAVGIATEICEQEHEECEECETFDLNDC